MEFPMGRGTRVFVFMALATAAFGADPFADLDARRRPSPAAVQPVPPTGPFSRFFEENFTFKLEEFVQVSAIDPPTPEGNDLYTRPSIGFEVYKKFSNTRSTDAAADLQVRLVRRDNFIDVPDDMDGMNRPGWTLEYHNAYVDLYNVADVFLDLDDQRENLGRFNARVGHFYLPFGLNLQTDTHGTLLQLSNGRNFGYERDWYAGVWGYLTENLNYDVDYLAGRGYDFAFFGPCAGLFAARVSLNNRVTNETGLEGGVSVMAGERVDATATTRSPTVAIRSEIYQVVQTARFGMDARYSHMVPTGRMTYTLELSTGQDEPDEVFTQLYQIGYLSSRRSWGADVQYRRFWQDIGDGRLAFAVPQTDESVIGEVTHYFRNDIGNTHLEWIKLNVEQRLARQDGQTGTVYTLQYYRFW
jgi:hypothetical protein